MLERHMKKLRLLDLFSGVGCFSLGLERSGGFETVAFCEIEEFPRRVLAKHWPDVYCHNDVRTLNKETLCIGYAENAVLNRLCKEMGGNLLSVKNAIETINAHVGKKHQTNTTNGRQSAEGRLSNTTAASALVAGNESMSFWQLITSTIMDRKSGQNTNELLGKSLRNEDFQTIIRFFATIAIQQRPSTVPALIKETAAVNHDDVRTLTAARLASDGIAVDAICGGFPCQDISIAGPGAGLAGERSGLFYEIIRLICELEPQYVILENVSELLGRGMGDVLGSLAGCGYDAEWRRVRASDIGLPQERDRVFILAYPMQDRRPGFLESINFGAHGQGWSGSKADLQSVIDLALVGSDRFPQPLLRRVDGRPANWVDRVGALGNAVVPQIPELIGRAIISACPDLFKEAA